MKKKEQTPPGAVKITVQHPTTCLSCDDKVRIGDEAYWVKGIGAWHAECPPPRNLKLYVKELQ